MMFLLLLLLLQSTASSNDVLEVRMPGVSILRNDTYYHLQYELKSGTIFITGYRSVVSEHVQNIQLYGCSGNTRGIDVWIGGTPCSEDQDPEILWCWQSPGEPEFHMPHNVSMIAGDTGIRYLVVKIHYKTTMPQGHQDSSGIDIFYSSEQTKFQAGIYLLEAEHGTFPPGKRGLHIDLECNFTSSRQMSVFAFRTHSHKFATLISGFRVRNDTWLHIGSRDPSLPEMFLMTDHVIKISTGDRIHARCEYDTRGTNETVVIGNTKQDEMCNLYLMFYTESILSDDVDTICSHTVTLSDEKVSWYSAVFRNGRNITILAGIILTLLVCVPLMLTLKNYYCPPTSRRSYKKSYHDGFQKLFEEDDEEDEILYRSRREY